MCNDEHLHFTIHRTSRDACIENFRARFWWFGNMVGFTLVSEESFYNWTYSLDEILSNLEIRATEVYYTANFGMTAEIDCSVLWNMKSCWTDRIFYRKNSEMRQNWKGSSVYINVYEYEFRFEYQTFITHVPCDCWFLYICVQRLRRNIWQRRKKCENLLITLIYEFI